MVMALPVFLCSEHSSKEEFKEFKKQLSIDITMVPEE